MILTNQELSTVVFGACEKEQSENGVKFFRMTQKQALAFTNHSADLTKKTSATAGIFLDFYTDSDFFAFAYDNAEHGASRPWYYFELLIDGESVALIGEENAERKKGEFFKELKKGVKRITLVFPCLFSARLVKVELSDGATITPVKKKNKILFFGDSITQGYDSKCPSENYVNRILLKTDSEGRNLAIGAACFWADTIPDDYDFNPDFVFVAYGTNDWNYKTAFTEFKQDCTAYFEKLNRLYGEKPFFVILPIWRSNYMENHPVGDYEKVRSTIAEISSSYKNVTVIDLWDTLPHELSLFTDGLHPNEKGFAVYAEAVLKALRDRQTH